MIHAAVRLCQALKVITGILKSKLKLAGGPEESADSRSLQELFPVLTHRTKNKSPEKVTVRAAGSSFMFNRKWNKGFVFELAARVNAAPPWCLWESSRWSGLQQL